MFSGADWCTESKAGISGGTISTRNYTYIFKCYWNAVVITCDGSADPRWRSARGRKDTGSRAQPRRCPDCTPA